MTQVETLWRCETCGKRSHAKRRPKQHERFIRGDDPDPLDPDGKLPVLGVEPESESLAAQAGDQSHYDYDPGGRRVACGPFGMWRAERRP